MIAGNVHAAIGQDVFYTAFNRTRLVAGLVGRIGNFVALNVCANGTDRRRKMNRNDALNGNSWHYGNCTRTTGPRGGVRERIVHVRRSGQNKTWKTRPDDFRVPVKHGMYDSGEIVPENVAEFHKPEDCPLLDGNDHTADETHTTRVQPVTYNSMLPNMTFYRAICTCGFKSPETHFYSSALIAKAGHKNMARGNPPIIEEVR